MLIAENPGPQGVQCAGNAICQMVPFSMILNEPDLFSRSHHSLTLNVLQTATDTAIVTIEGE